jgi:succinyl-CoA synthetase alpha subunit
MVLITDHLRQAATRLLGPGTIGAFSPGQCLAGMIPQDIATPGSIGVLSRSGSLAYEVTHQLTRAGLGQSTILSIGSGAIFGMGFAQILAMFEGDPVTERIVLIGEVGGREEELAAEFIVDSVSKPVVAMITGQTSPPGRQMGHSGAIIEDFADTAQHKISVLERAGVRVARFPAEIVECLTRSESEWDR